MLGTAKETHHESPGVLLPACALLFSHQHRHALAARSLAGSSYHRHHRYCHRHWFPYLEAQA